jgi:hypothetical protein
MPTDSQPSVRMPPPPPALPEHIVSPLPPFVDDYGRRVAEGQARLRHAKVAFVGLARNCAGPLIMNLNKLLDLADLCGSWAFHVETNDNEDATDDVLAEFCRQHRQATFTSQRLGRQQFSTEFAGRRTIALAEYRDACQRWVRDCAADADYVVVIDFDAWGGWWHDGVLAGFGWMLELQAAYGMASVSLLETRTATQTSDGKITVGRAWAHYDAWALRGVGQPDVTWDDYSAGYGGWKHQWLPPVGSTPALVASAFGGFCIYRTGPYLAGTYDGTADCEHVPFHASIRKATGQNLYLCPSMRTFMTWLGPEDATRRDGDD